MNENEIQRLIDAPEDQFRKMVDQEVRGPGFDASEEEKKRLRKMGELLRDPRLRDRWYLALVQMKKSVESQLSSKRSDILKSNGLTPEQIAERWAEYHRWKAGAIRFKSGVEDRLLEIRGIRGRTQPDSEAVKRERNSLLQAITEHRELVLKEFPEDEISDADRSLWAVLGD